MVKDYAYAGTDFRGDPDLPLPPGRQWGDMGKKQNPKMDICVFLSFNVFLFFMYSNETRNFHADVGVARPGGSSPLDRKVGARFVQ